MHADQSAHNLCSTLARDHYENFPVTAIDALAGTAYNFADQNALDTAGRLASPEGYRAHFDALQRGHRPETPVFAALADAVRAHALPLRPLYDRLAAYRQDVTQIRYAHFSKVLDYCAHSANPIGRLLLQLFAAGTAANRAYAHAICIETATGKLASGHGCGLCSRMRLSGSQRNAAFRHQRTAYPARCADSAWRAMIDSDIARARTLPGRIGLGLRFIVAGGITVLGKLRGQHRTGFIGDARLAPYDWLRILRRHTWIA